MSSRLQQLIKKRRLQKDPKGVLLEEIEKLNSGIDDLKKKEYEYELELHGFDFKGDKGDSIKGERGEKGDSIKGESGYTPIKGIDYSDGQDGKDGKDADETKITSKLVKYLNGKIQDFKKVIISDLKNYLINLVDKIPKSKDGKDGLNGKPPKHEIKLNRIRFENPDGTWGVWIELEKKDTSFGKRTLHRGGLDLVRDDLTSQCDGATTTFTLTATPKADTVQLWSTQFPVVYRPIIDYTVSGKTITLVTAEVGTPQSGQTLVALYVKS